MRPENEDHSSRTPANKLRSRERTGLVETTSYNGRRCTGSGTYRLGNEGNQCPHHDDGFHMQQQITPLGDPIVTRNLPNLCDFYRASSDGRLTITGALYGPVGFR